MSEGLIPWTAGFLEGEGTFDCKDGYPRIKAVQVEREPLEILRREFGGSISIERRTGLPGQGNRRDISVWTFSGTRAGALMCELRPYLSERRRIQVARALGESPALPLAFPSDQLAIEVA